MNIVCFLLVQYANSTNGTANFLLIERMEMETNSLPFQHCAMKPKDLQPIYSLLVLAQAELILSTSQDYISQLKMRV